MRHGFQAAGFTKRLVLIAAFALYPLWLVVSNSGQTVPPQKPESPPSAVTKVSDVPDAAPAVNNLVILSSPWF